MKNYYNEYDKKASASLKQLIADGLIPNGDVDDRSIAEVTAGDLRGYTQHHFFCGVVGWSRALQLAGWPDTRPVWTGSCPCQPYSSAGKQKGAEDERDLWPVWFRLMRGYVEKVGDIPTVFGEQVASAIAHGWLDRVYSDMEGLGYAVGSLVFPACSVDAPHRRDRVGLVADAAGIGGGKREQNTGRRAAGIADKKQSIADKPCSGALGDTESRGARGHGAGAEPDRKETCGGRFDNAGSGCIRPLDDTFHEGSQGQPRNGLGEERREITARSAPEAGFWDAHDWIICGDGKARRIPPTESGIRLLAHGIPERVGLLRAAGNAICPPAWAKFIKGYMELHP